MLDTVRRMGELRDLVVSAKQEREALSSALATLTVKKRSIDEAVETLTQTQKLTQSVSEALDRVSARLDAVDARSSVLIEFDDKVARLSADVRDSRQVVDSLLGPEGELAKHQRLTVELSAQEVAARSNLDLIRKERQALDEMRDQLRQSGIEVRDAAERFTNVKLEFDQIRTLSLQLGQDYAQIREASRDARSFSQDALDAAKETESRVASLKTLDEVARSARERINALNVLVEHVSQKARAMEAQKQTIEHAIVESNRLNEMVWNMETQIATLNEGMRQVPQAEAVIDRLAKAGDDAKEQLDLANKARESFLQELGRLERDRAALTEFMRAYQERMDAERRQLDQFDERVAIVQSNMASLESSADALAARDRTITAMGQQIDSLEQQAVSLGTGIGDLQQKQTALDTLRGQLTEVEAFARRTTQQFETLRAVRDDLVVLKQQIDAFHKSHAEAAQLRDAIDANRMTFGAFLDRMDGFRKLMPELDARLNTIAGKLSVVDEGSQKASNLVALADNLDRQMTRIINNQKLVEKVETRINALHGIASDVDRKVEEQLNRRVEIDNLKNACDGVAVQVADVQQKIEAVTAVQTSLVPLTTLVDTLKNDVERAHLRLQSVQRDEAAIVEQEKRLADLVLAGRTAADDVHVTLQQVQTLTEELRRSTTVKGELLEELTAVQSRQREVASHAAVSDDQLKRLEAAVVQMEHRRNQLTFVERTILGFETKLNTLRQEAEELDHRIEDVSARTTIVDAVRREVDGVRELSARSKADLEALDERRSDIATIKGQVESILLKAAQTQEQLARVEARRRDVDEIYDRTGLIVSMLEDVRLNLEMVNEQKAVVEDVVSDLAKLDSLVRSGQRALKSLQAERELAERIERSIKALRAKSGVSEDEAKRLA